MPKKTAEEIKTKVEALNAANVAGMSWDKETAEWVGGRESALYDKLAAIGLVSRRAEVEQATLEAFLDSYIDKQIDKKQSTIVCLTQCRNDLVEFFGPEKPLGDVSEGDAEDWRNWLRKRNARPGRQKSPTGRASKASYRDRNKPKQPPKRLQENTIRRRCGRARQLFQAAVRYRLIGRNPFAEIQGRKRAGEQEP